MDLNDYTLMLLLRDRHTDMVAAAQRNALLREATRLRRPFRAVLGSALIRVDAWIRRLRTGSGRQTSISTSAPQATRISRWSRRTRAISSRGRRLEQHIDLADIVSDSWVKSG